MDKSLKLLAIAVLILVLAGCGPAVPVTPQATRVLVTQPPPPVPTLAGGAALRVTGPGGLSKDFSLDALKAMPQSSVAAEGTTEQGVKLLDVLKAAGVTTFTQLSLGGSSSLMLKPEVASPALVTFAADGKLSCAIPGVPREQWPKQIIQIKIK